MHCPSRVATFVNDESGAITVDWTVLTAGLVGMGIASYGVVSGGLSDVSGDVRTQMRMQRLSTSFGSMISYDDFSNGADGWVGAVTENVDAAYGAILGRFGGTGGQQTVSKIFDVDENMPFAVAEFDLHAIDSWDSETLTIFADDTPITGYQFRWQTPGVIGGWTSNDGRYDVQIEASTEREQIGYSRWSDQSYRVKVTVADPNDTLKLGFGSTLNQSINDESWAIDNVSVTSTTTP